MQMLTEEVTEMVQPITGFRLFMEYMFRFLELAVGIVKFTIHMTIVIFFGVFNIFFRMIGR